MELIVTSQQEWDDIPQNFAGIVTIDAPADVLIRVAEKKGSRLVIKGNSTVQIIRPHKEATGKLYESEEDLKKEQDREREEERRFWSEYLFVVIAKDRAVVETAFPVYLTAFNKAVVKSWLWGTIVANDSSRISAERGPHVIAKDSSYIEVLSCSVEVFGESHVMATGMSSVTKESSSSMVLAYGHTQVNAHFSDKNVTLHGNARVVGIPQTVEDYLAFFGIPQHEGWVKLYRAVKQDMTDFREDGPHYNFGRTYHAFAYMSYRKSYHAESLLEGAEDAFPVMSLETCFMLAQREKSPFKIIECFIPISKLLVPPKWYPFSIDCPVFWAKEITVLREVPEDEWGIGTRIMKAAKNSGVELVW